jgi:hypothetical protein
MSSMINNRGRNHLIRTLCSSLHLLLGWERCLRIEIYSECIVLIGRILNLQNYSLLLLMFGHFGILLSADSLRILNLNDLCALFHSKHRLRSSVVLSSDFVA